MAEQLQNQSAAGDDGLLDDAPTPTHEGNPALPPEVTAVLRDLRRSLLQHPEIARSVSDLRNHVSMRDFYVSFVCLLLGTAGQAYAVLYQSWLIPVFLVLALAGIAGWSSLGHEGWHGRAVPNKKFDQWLSKWAISAVFLIKNEAHARDHKLHHRVTGEPQDPQAYVWDQPWEEFRKSQMGTFLLIPAALKMAKAILTGKREDSGFNDDTRRASLGILVAIGLVHGTWALGLLWASPWAFLFGYLLPLSWGSVCAQLRQYREHARLPDGSTAVFDLMCNNLERVLIPGGFFNYHILHHTFPEIPQRSLPKLYKVVSRTVDMKKDYYGLSPQLGLKHSYLNNTVIA
jgi:fatty acid desaturase